MKKRIISAALAACILLCLLPTAAIAMVGDAAKLSGIKPDTMYFMRVAINFNGQYSVAAEGDPSLGLDYFGYPLPSKTQGAKAVLSPIPDSRYRHPLDLRDLAVKMEPDGKKFRIIVQQSGLYLTAQGEGLAIVQMPKDSSKKQLFELVEVKRGGTGFYVKVSDGTYLTVSGSKDAAASGTVLIASALDTKSGKIQQEFSFCPVYTDDPKMSDWAKPHLTYMPRDTAYGNDFTKKFTMTSQALYDVVTGVLPGNPKYLPGAISDTAVGDESDGIVWRLTYWGIYPAPEIPSASRATKEGLAVYLMRTINYINKYNFQNSVKLSRANLSKYSDGGQVSAWAKDAMAVMVAHGVITPTDGKLNPKSDVSIEEMLIMCGRVRTIFSIANNVSHVKDGMYSVRNRLGNNMAINAAGQGELNSAAKQNFRFTYKYTKAVSTNNCGDYYTIQTQDGKYLAIEGTPVEGSRLIAQDKEYIWRVIYSGSENYQNVYVLMPGEAPTVRVLGAYKGQTKDGTPLVTWKKNSTASEKEWKTLNTINSAYEANAKFYLDAPVDFDPNKPPPVTPTPTAIPSSTKLMANGNAVSVDAYSIDGNNYIKLRDLAFILNSTEKNFEVSWDGEKNAINLKSRTPYTPVGGEMMPGTPGNKPTSLTTSAIYVDGVKKAMTAYLIGQSNYFKLRDVMQIFDVYVGYDAATGTATLDTSKGYEVPGETPSEGDAVQDGVYQLVTAINTKNCVAIGSSSKESGAAAVTWTNMNIDDQKFTIQKQGKKYSITAVHSGMALTINGTDSKGATIVQKEYVGSEAQLFSIVSAGNGYVNIVSGNGFYFGVGGGKTTKGAEIVLWTATKASDQQFKLKPVS